MQQIDQIVSLLKHKVQGTLSPENETVLEKMLLDHPRLQEIVQEFDSTEKMLNAVSDYQQVLNVHTQEREEVLLDDILIKVRQQRHDSAVTPIYPVRRRRYLYIAASCFLMFLLAGYLILEQQKPTKYLPHTKISDFNPGKKRAFLEMDDGKKLVLSDAHDGISMMEALQYSDGTVIADEQEIAAKLMTLTVPRGGEYQVVLSDGTKVWLNADSKLSYPKSFEKDQREVTLIGEAYFEVSSDKNRPFIVHTKNQTVEVLGTHFNIAAYLDESVSLVSLVEGKIRVSHENQPPHIVMPGQQAAFMDGQIQVYPVNVAEFTAWKNGEFIFNNEPLATVMQKLARWYDVELVLENKLENMKIWGSIARSSRFSHVLQLIKMTDEDIHYKIEGRRVTFMK
ncbi:FecR family protein [Sphingobacterium faecium]|uniref:FecR family protein n=1 Tax=Sphingobacterium faecium TaxID=34087 RepID=UPI002469491F|nr:FecR family protein [Sphingobacterium faecium]MDH5828741.1 FecR domain-containing protein [Sphingobacterium faecium]